MMHRHLEDAGAALGISDRLNHLRSTAADSDDLIAFCRNWLHDQLEPDNAPSDIIAFGSLARREFTPASDFDYLVVAHHLDPRPRGPRDLLTTADRLRSEMAMQQGMAEGSEVPSPGGTKLFGVIVSAMDISERIGLQDDTNHDHTRRLLLLEESVSLLQPERHRSLVTTILGRYLDGYAGEPKHGVPRFLLNDVVRYWRTLTVDYQAKVWGNAGSWGLRYLKLIVSRKLAYAGTLASLLTCSDDEPATVEHLVDQFETPPLARLAQLHLHLADDEPALEALSTALTTADAFIERSSDSEWRERVKRVTDLSSASSNPDFEEMRRRARELQAALEVIFFDSHALASKSRKYLSF